MNDPAHDRYGRQALFSEIGPEGQAKIGRARVAIVGIGALGCQQAALLARAGIGTLRLIDRDFVEETNLQRQILFTEQDAREAVPKALAAREHLSRANSRITLEAEVRDVTAASVEALLEGIDLIVDGSDNFEVRYLLNDFAVRTGKPWIYAAAVGATGLIMPILPGKTPCLRCLFEDAPPAGSTETCDTAGVVGPVTSVIGALSAMEALKLAAGRTDAVSRGLLQVDLWFNEFRGISADSPREGCPCCQQRLFPHLESKAGGSSVELCGRNAVQVSPTPGVEFDFTSVRERLAKSGALLDNGYLLRFQAAGLEVTLFQDGRAILKGTDDPAQARAVYSRYVGN